MLLETVGKELAVLPFFGSSLELVRASTGDASSKPSPGIAAIVEMIKEIREYADLLAHQGNTEGKVAATCCDEGSMPRQVAVLLRRKGDAIHATSRIWLCLQHSGIASTDTS